MFLHMHYALMLLITIMIFFVEVVLEWRANKHGGGRSHQSPVAVSAAAHAKCRPLVLSCNSVYLPKRECRQANIPV